MNPAHFRQMAKALLQRKRSGATAQELAAFIREQAEEARAAVCADFLENNDAFTAISTLSRIMDAAINAWLYVSDSKRLRQSFAVIATGGYGRQTLFPFSDVDVVITSPKPLSKPAKALVEGLLYFLWDMKLQLGQQVAVEDSIIALAREDVAFLTSLLDMRHVAGSREIAQSLENRFWGEVVSEEAAPAFVEAKLQERDARHEKDLDSRYVLEPKLKEGKGGLRDLQFLYWIARFAFRIRTDRDFVRLGLLEGREVKAYKRAWQFIFTVRFHLHLVAGRAEERLTFDYQKQIAERMGYRDRGSMLAVERLMKGWFVTSRSIGLLTHILLASFEDRKMRKKPLPFVTLKFNTWKLNGFVEEGGRITLPYEGFLSEKPERMLEIFALAQQLGLDIHPKSLHAISRSLSLVNADLRASDEANRLFMDMLTSPKQPHITLRRMNEAGVLGKFIPDFGRIVGQMQFDMYHTFTVDEHTINAISILDGIRHGQFTAEFPLSSQLIGRLDSLPVLYLAVFCHDIAKGRGGDHSILGERVARKLARRMGMREDEAETCAWLVREHLLMSRTAFKRDLSEAKTIQDFVARVQTPERLMLLVLLTVADIRAVGPKVWNSWKGALLRELYARAAEAMGVAEARLSLKAQEERVREVFAQKGQDAENYLAAVADGVLTAFSPEAQSDIARFMEQGGGYHLAVREEVKLHVTEVTLAAEDRRGLFAEIAAAISAAGANIVGAKIFTMKNGFAVDQFFIQDAGGRAFAEAEPLQRLESALAAIIHGAYIPAERFHEPRFRVKSKAFDVPVRVLVDNTISATHTVIEVVGQDRTGLLYHLTRALSDEQLSISTAHITSYGERVVDVFYVKDRFGHKLLHEGKMAQVKQHLLSVMERVSA